MTMDDIFAWFGATTMDELLGKLLAYVCYVTAATAAVLSMKPTWASWKRKALGPGDRRPDPTMAALVGNAAWFAFGCITKSGEPLWVNLGCGFIQMINLATYLMLCTEAERRGVFRRFWVAGTYLAITVCVGLFMPDWVELLKCICLASGAVAPVVPIVIAVRLTEARNKRTDRLPNWYVSAESIVNGLLWVIRGRLISNIYMEVQNGVGAFCSVWLLVLLFRWDEPEAEAGPDNNYPPLLQDNPPVLEDNPTAQQELTWVSRVLDYLARLQIKYPPALPGPPAALALPSPPAPPAPPTPVATPSASSVHSQGAMDGPGSSHVNKAESGEKENESKAAMDRAGSSQVNVAESVDKDNESKGAMDGAGSSHVNKAESVDKKNENQQTGSLKAPSTTEATPPASSEEAGAPATPAPQANPSASSEEADAPAPEANPSASPEKVVVVVDAPEDTPPASSSEKVEIVVKGDASAPPAPASSEEN